MLGQVPAGGDHDPDRNERTNKAKEDAARENRQFFEFGDGADGGGELEQQAQDGDAEPTVAEKEAK
jgi:hypothetical protein